MSTTPTTPPPEQPSRPSYGYAPGVSDALARLPIPGNAEFAVYLLVEAVLALLWIFAESVNTSNWATFTTALTFGYFISRGIAKASRVLEQ